MKAEVQPQSEEQPQDLNPEIVHLRRAVAEAEVRAERLDMENADLRHDLRQAREALDLRNRRIVDLEANAEALVVARKAKADEAEETRVTLATADARVTELSEQLNATITRLTEGWGR